MEVVADNRLTANDSAIDGKPLTHIIMLSLPKATKFTSYSDMYETINS